MSSLHIFKKDILKKLRQRQRDRAACGTGAGDGWGLPLLS